MSWVNLEPLYTEPDMKYHLLSSCLFFKEKYTKTSNGNGKVKEVSLMKQQMISKCIEEHAKDYEQGIWDKNVRLRICFDKSIHKSSLLNDCFEKYLHHPFFQWVRYDIPEMRSINPSFHKGFIGTIVRFHPLFVRSSNVVAVSIVDLDNKYTSKWKEMIHKFIKSDYDIHYISGIFYMTLYSVIIQGVTKEDDPSILWSGGGMFSSKILFPRSRWNNMLTHMQSNSILGRLRFIDSFRVSLYNTTEMFMEEFEYGIDEILLNDMIYYYIDRNLVKPMVTKVNPMYLYVNYYQKMILDYLKWNDGKTEQMDLLYKTLHVSSYAELEDKVNSFETLEQLFRYFKKKDVSEILWHLQFNRRLLYLIQEYNPEKVRKTPRIYEYLVG